MLTWLETIKTQSVSFLKTDPIILSLKQFELSKTKYRNYIEAAICSMIIDNFRGCGVDPGTITVICPFLEQANMLGEHVKPVKVLTIDKA